MVNDPFAPDILRRCALFEHVDDDCAGRASRDGSGVDSSGATRSSSTRAIRVTRSTSSHAGSVKIVLPSRGRGGGHHRHPPAG